MLGKLYKKSELAFALLWIGVYCVLLSLGDNFSQNLGVEKSVTLPVAAVLSVLLFVFIKKNGLSKKYGLCKPCVCASGVLYYVPLLLLLSVNLWHGVVLNLTVAETVLYVLTMLLVGFLEETIFRGLLFKAMEKDSPNTAVVVSAITFGFGHIINLFNGSGADLLQNILQVIYASATGFMLVILFVKTKSLIIPVAFHGAFNALSAFAYEAEFTAGDRIITCLFISGVSVAYALFLILAKKGKKKNDNTYCEQK